jgi:transposase
MSNVVSSRAETVEVEVSAKAKRRHFTAEYKREILKQAAACTERGELGALLRREGLYSSHLTEWRAAVERGGLAALVPKKRGPAPKEVDSRDRQIADLERQVARMTKRAERAEALVELQKNYPRGSSHLLDEKRPERYGRRGPGGAAGRFLETAAIP